ncbi:MAG: YigZ family protein [Oscillospiraceae bacterium]|jgi:uncharacterized YigZ family protein|nr:YigZ family protein [Oscillospiraceae bacterium]
MEEYLLPLKLASGEFIEKKSRFIGTVAPVKSEQEALDFLRLIRSEYRDASHNVYAYHIRKDALCRHSDDGEPSGTGGMPLLEVFTQRKVFDFCCVATRYFGGVLLGAGGLTRAYARCGVEALAVSGLAAMRAFSLGRFICDYARYDILRRVLEDSTAEIGEVLFTDRVEVNFCIAASGWTPLCEKLTALSSGSVRPERLGESMRPVAV